MPRYFLCTVFYNSIIASQYDFPSTPRGNAIFFSIIWHKLFYHLSTYFISLEASCFLAKRLLLHKKQLLADLCGWLGSFSPSLVTQNILPPACICWQHSILDTLELSQFILKLLNLLFLFLNYPNIFCINPDILQRWCNEAVCRHSWCWCWWRCRSCVGFTLFFMSSHHCWWTMQSQSDSGCVDFEKNKELCSLSLDTVILDQCANDLPWFEMITCHFSSSNFWYTEEFNMHILKTKNIVCILVI